MVLRQQLLRSSGFFVCALAISGVFLPMSSALAAGAKPTPTFWQSVMERDRLTGDWGGYRTKLEDKGISLNAVETLESFGNYSGGVKRGQLVEGMLNTNLSLDFEKLAHIKGLTGYVSSYQIHGNGISTPNLGGNLMTISSVEGERNTRLADLWLQQNLFDDNLSIRAGQLAADEEFITSDYAGLYINSEYGWPNMLAADLPSSGPGYPLTTPGVRVKVGQTQPWSFQVAVFDGDPAGHGYGDTSQQKNSSGTNFNLDKGAFIMSEAAYGRNHGKDDAGLAATYKLGGWYHTEDFPDQRNSDVSHKGNYGFYGVVDQKLWKNGRGEDGGIGVFARYMISPSDRNLAEWQLDTGVNWKGVFKDRDDDTLGLALSYINIGEQARDADRDAGNALVSDHEAQLELTYQAPITPWLTVQPDFQYIFHPGANVANPNDSTGALPIKDAVIGGVRLKITF